MRQRLRRPSFKNSTEQSKYAWHTLPQKKRGETKNIKNGGAMWAASLNTLFDKKKTKKNKQKKNKKNYHTLTTTARTIREP